MFFVRDQLALDKVRVKWGGGAGLLIEVLFKALVVFIDCVIRVLVKQTDWGPEHLEVPA